MSAEEWTHQAEDGPAETAPAPEAEPVAVDAAAEATPEAEA
jgi:hypothetical protein